MEAATIQIAIELLTKLSFWQSLKMRLSGVAKALASKPANPRDAESGFMPAVLHINGEEMIILKHPEPLAPRDIAELIKTMKEATPPGTRGLVIDGGRTIGWFGPDARGPASVKAGGTLEREADADKR